MAEWRITGPDGNEYKVTAPPGATKKDVMARIPGADVPKGVKPTGAGFMRALAKTGKTLDNIARSVAAGFTGEYADEIAAYMNATIGDGDYSQTLAAEKQRDVGIPLATKIGGGLAGGVAAMGVAGPRLAATGVGKLASRLPGIVKNTALGGGLGAVYGSGMAEEDERLAGAAHGAKFGAGAGALIHGGIGAGKWVMDKTGNWLQNPVRALSDPEGQAVSYFSRGMADDMQSPGQMMGRTRELGPKASFLDAAEAEGNVQSMGRALTGTTGPAKQHIMGMFKKRGEEESGRATKTITRDLGKGDPFDLHADYIVELRANAQPAWDAAYTAHPVLEMSPVLRRMLRNPRVQAGIKMASKTANDLRTAGETAWIGPVDQELTALARMAKDMGVMEGVGRSGVAAGFSLETWQAVKSGLDQLIKSRAYTNELTGTVNTAGRGIAKMKGALVRELDRLTGGKGGLYSVARKQYAGDAEMVDAVMDGTKFLKKRPALIRAEKRALSASGRKAYENGASGSLRDVIDKTPDSASASRGIYGTQYKRDQLNAALPSQEAVKRVERDLRGGMTMKETENFMTKGARTTPMKEEMDALKKGMGSVGAIAASSLPGGHALVRARIGREYMQRMIGTPHEMNMVLAKMLTTRNPAEQQRIMEMVKILRQGTRPRTMSVAAERGLTLGAAQQ